MKIAKFTWALLLNVLIILLPGSSLYASGNETGDNPQKGDYTINAVHDIMVKNNKILVFPNPTKDIIKVRISNVPRGGLYVAIININGKVLLKNSGDNKQSEVHMDLGPFPAGNYLLKVGDNKGNHLQTFQVIKH